MGPWPAQRNAADRAVSNYAADAGRSSGAFSTSSGWRRALLGTVAAGALTVAYGRTARAQVVPPAAPCNTVSGTEVTCTGDVSAGISTGAPFTVLNVNTLTDDITPAAGVHGIHFVSGGDIEINSNTGTYSISVTGADTEGIRARATGGGTVTVNSTGDITSAHSRGIYANNVGAGTVTVISNGKITADNNGIHAHSIGVGSGAVRVESTGDIRSYDGTGIFAVNNDAGAVDVISAGTITAEFNGIYVRSHTGQISVESTGNISSTRAEGIYAFNYGADAGDISVESVGDIEAHSAGIRAVSEDGAVTIDSTGNIDSATNRGIHARSFGDGDIKVTSDGRIEAEFEGIFAETDTGAIEIYSTGNITSHGSEAIWAIGAGNVEVESKGDIEAQWGGIFARADTGAVRIDSTGDITSHNAQGIYARNDGASDIEVISDGNIHADSESIVAVSSLGAVVVHSSGKVTSTSSMGILARSNGAGSVEVTSDGNIEADLEGIFAFSDTGTVTVDSFGDVTSTNTMGIQAFNFGTGNVEVISEGNVQARLSGIYARSYTGAITIESTGDVTSLTTDAIFAAYGTSIDITLWGGTVHGANDGVEFYASIANTLTNRATLSGGVLAVRGSIGNETVDNHGVIIGSVDLGVGTNAFNNLATGTFRSGAIVNLGAGNSLTNDGILTPGGDGAVMTTALTGNLVQTGTGTFVVDIDEGGAGADLLSVTGTADFAGLVLPNIINITSAVGSVQIADAAALTSTATAVNVGNYIFTLSLLNGDTELWLNWQIASILALLAGPLTPNQEATAIYLDALQNAGPDAALQALLDAIHGLPNEAEIVAALDRLHGEHYLAHIHSTLHSSLFFLNSALSCPTADGGPGPVTEGECLWAKVGTRHHDWDRTRTNIGGDEEAWSVSGGLQVALSESWRLGLAASYERTDITTGNAATSDGDRVQGAALLKTNWGPTTFAAALFGGYGWFDTTRTIGLAGIATAEGDHEIAFGGVHARLAHVIAQGGGWYLRPMLDLNATYLDYGGFQETGGGAAALSVRGGSDWVLSASPALEIGAEWRGADGSVVRPFVRAGVTVFNDADFALTSGFVGAPAGVTPFTVRSDFDEVTFDIGAGFDVLNLGGVDIKINYEGRFGEDSESHAGGIKAGVRF